jgi:hypothetical protein
MADSDSIKRRLKEDRIPEAFWPDEWGEKKKRPKEIAVIDVNLCFPQCSGVLSRRLHRAAAARHATWPR